MPEIGDNDVLEQTYMPKLRGILAEKGILLSYDIDRAAIDVGVHLWVDVDGKKDVSGPRVWFQAKGFHRTTITLAEYVKSDSINTHQLKINDIRYWYNAPEPVYIVLFVQSAEAFLAVDVRELVDRRGGLAKLEKLNQGTISFQIFKAETLERALERMPRHRSMRVDGPGWRGRPLGHGYDPLRSALAPMSPKLFIDVAGGLLHAHNFRLAEATQSLEDVLSVNGASILEGRMHLTYEWVLQMTTEFGQDEGSDFRIEGAPIHAQGNVLVVVDPIGDATPESLGIDLIARARAAAIDRVIVMANTNFHPTQFGQWFGGLRVAQLRCEPQDIRSLTFNVLTTTNVFLEFSSRLDFATVNYL